MTMLDQEGAFIIANLMTILVEELDESCTDEMLLSDYAYVFDALMEGVKYMQARNHEPPLLAIYMLARFAQAARDYEEQN